jgi:hypothetical protein
MIAMSMISTYEEYRREGLAAATDCPAPTRPVRRTLMRVLSMIGLGVGGVATIEEDDDFLGIG